ncbi:MAG: hypothetical protein ACTHN5_19700 [Phycisphaerae bacterium]
MVSIYNTPEGAVSDRNLVHDRDVEHHAHTGAAHSHVCWGAVIAGSVTAMSLMVLMASFAYAIDIPGYSNGDYGFATGLYAVFTAVVSFLIGGAVTSYFADRAEQHIGLLHGIMCWTLTVPLLLLLSGTAFGLFRMYAFSAFNRATAGQIVASGTTSDYHAAAWGAFIALFCGLLSAAIGGVGGFMSRRYTAKLHV